MKLELLKLLNAGFNYNSIKALEAQCSKYLMNASSSDTAFLFIVRQICFDSCELIEYVNGDVSLNNIIEQSIKTELYEMINSLDDESVLIKLNKAHNLIYAFQNAKKKINVR